AVRSSRCAATLYRDGRLDLVVNNFNDRAYYFRNRFPQKNSIAFRLTGARQAGEPAGPPGSNRDAIGAVGRLHVGLGGLDPSGWSRGRLPGAVVPDAALWAGRAEQGRLRRDSLAGLASRPASAHRPSCHQSTAPTHRAKTDAMTRLSSC